MFVFEPQVMLAVCRVGELPHQPGSDLVLDREWEARPSLLPPRPGLCATTRSNPPQQ